jgi:FkbM family methyltransferase
MGGDLSLEQFLVDRGAKVRSIDPVERFVREGEESFRDYPRFTAHLAAIARHDGKILMQPHHEDVSSSLSAAGLYVKTSKPTVVVPALALTTLMSLEGDEVVDFLKLDVEGLEYDIVPTLDLRAMGVRAFCIQVHHNRGLLAGHKIVRTVERQGLAYVAQRSSAKLTFVKL